MHIRPVSYAGSVDGKLVVMYSVVRRVNRLRSVITLAVLLPRRCATWILIRRMFFNTMLIQLWFKPMAFSVAGRTPRIEDLRSR